MDKQEKIKVAVTAGIAAVILLILVLFLALSGKKNNDGEKLEENIASYSDGQKEASENASAITTSKETPGESELANAEDSGTTGSSVVTYSEQKDTAKNQISGNSFYVAGQAHLKGVYKNVEYNVHDQLKEISKYWAEGNTEAVRDLAHLERFEAMSDSLGSSSDFYYYGEMDADSLPNGTGVAVYANDQYYYGQWVNGKRSGDGTWFSFYPVYNNYVVKEHMYSGQWSDDRPNGKGQEHYDYDPEYMNSADIYLQNIIGVFSEGLYNGSMYVITVDKNSNTIEWDGVCNKGTWNAAPGANKDSKGRIPVLSNRLDKDNHMYMTEEGAKNNGVSTLIYGGNVRK